MNDRIRTEIFPDAEAVARRAAAFIAEQFLAASAARGRFLLAISGGRTPWRMLNLLAEIDLPWSELQLFQTDERVAPAGSSERNLTQLRSSLLDQVPIPHTQGHAMPVGEEDLQAAADRYGATLRKVAGDPPLFDLVHLGLGADGHTASLFPGDPAVEATGSVAIATAPDGTRRMTLTLPVLSNARTVLWVVTGSEKRQALTSLLNGSSEIPAGRVPVANALLIADEQAIGAPR